jgi:nitrite reductase/ring-hydroxylating ferredoxin subunit
VTQEENDLLMKTGRGTPCGEFMRRYWQPAALSQELAADKPLPVQLFGEELILFRDGEGKPALIGRYCAHQGVDMIYGRVEPDGIRCMYHGWLFDACGKVIVRGGWVEGGEKRMEVGQPAHPCLEVGGVIFTYMGPDPAQALPTRELFINPPAPLTWTKVLHNENYLQGILRGNEAVFNEAKFVMPNLVAYQGTSSRRESWLSWRVPVDDNSHEEFTVGFFGAAPLNGEPLYAARQILVKAMDEIRLQLRASPDTDMKNP